MCIRDRMHTVNPRQRVAADLSYILVQLQIGRLGHAVGCLIAGEILVGVAQKRQHLSLIHI